MTLSTIPRRARYTLHLAPAITYLKDSVELVQRLDGLLEAPTVGCLTLHSAAMLDHYVSIRPEHFENIEAAVQSTQWQVGPWYVCQSSGICDIESTVRNLSLGVRTVQALAGAKHQPKAAWLPADLPLYWFLPQVLSEFGIQTAITARRGDETWLEWLLEGGDGSTINLCLAEEIDAERALVDIRADCAPRCQTGHILITGSAIPNGLTGFPDTIRESHLGSYAAGVDSVARAQIFPAKAATIAGNAADGATKMILDLEILAAMKPECIFPRPQQWIRKLWQARLTQAPGWQEIIRAEVEPFGVFDTSPAKATPGFEITTCKLPDNPEKDGVVVRGYNATENALPVTLQPCRPFQRVEVLRLDESPTGGTLNIDANGAITFRAAPRRLLTFWFRP